MIKELFKWFGTLFTKRKTISVDMKKPSDGNVYARIVCRFADTKLDFSKFYGKDVYIMISLPDGLKGKQHVADDVFYLESTLQMLQSLEKTHGIRLGKVKILVSGQILENDYFLKFPREMRTRLKDALKGLSLNPTAEDLANHLAVALHDTAKEKEDYFIKMYKDYLARMQKEASPSEKLTIDFHVQGLDETFREMQPAYDKAQREIQTLYREDEEFKLNLESARDNFLMRGTKNNIIEFAKQVKAVRPDLKGQPISFFEQSAKQMSMNYLLTEAPFFSAVNGNLIYNKVTLRDIFHYLIEKNKNTDFFPVSHDPVVEKPQPVVGSSARFPIQSQYVPKNDNKNSATKKSENKSIAKPENKRAKQMTIIPVYYSEGEGVMTGKQETPLSATSKQELVCIIEQSKSPEKTEEHLMNFFQQKRHAALRAKSDIKPDIEEPRSLVCVR